MLCQREEYDSNVRRVASLKPPGIHFSGKVATWLAACRMRTVVKDSGEVNNGGMTPERRKAAPRGLRAASVSLVAAGVFFACSAVSTKGIDDESGVNLGDGDLDGGDSSAGDGDAFEPPPEMELEETFRAPVVVGKYLFSANPETNKVARIDASTGEIEVLDGGHAPTYLAALPPGATLGGALVLNERSNDASVFLLDADGNVDSHDRLGVQRGASAWAVGREGKFAIAWSDSRESLLNMGDGYQDLTAFDFRGDRVFASTLSVGFRPSQVIINHDESRAFVVSEPGISVIRLGDEISVLRELFLPEADTVAGRDVSFSLDGRFAFVRLEGKSEILIVDTNSNDRVTVPMPGVVTDLDLSSDGTMAVAVMRGGQLLDDDGMGGAPGLGGSASTGGSAGESADSRIALLPTASIFENPSDFELFSTSEIVGSAVVASDGSYVLLFTNATESTFLTILDTESLDARIVDLKAPVRAAFLSDDVDYSVVLLDAPPQSSMAGAFALLAISRELPARIEGTPTAPEFVSISGDSGRALITTASTNSQRAHTYFGRFPSLQLDDVELPSRPLASGIIPDAGQAFVAQEHPEGRVTFIDLESGEDQTVTGFELSSRVVQP